MPRKPKLTAGQESAIQQTYARGEVGMKELAARYGVSISTISRIITKPTKKKP